MFTPTLKFLLIIYRYSATAVDRFFEKKGKVLLHCHLIFVHIFTTESGYKIHTSTQLELNIYKSYNLKFNLNNTLKVNFSQFRFLSLDQECESYTFLSNSLSFARYRVRCYDGCQYI